MVTETAPVRLTCPDCGKDDLKGKKGLNLHGRFCPAAPVPEGTENASEVVAEAAEQQPAAVLGKASWRAETAPPAAMPVSVRDPQSAIQNTTHAWYFAPPTVDGVEMLRTTGLPDDVFHSAPSWMSHQVQSQRDQGHILVMPIDAFGMKKKGSPYVHVMPPLDEDWDEIVTLWRSVVQQEIEVEQEMLDQAEADLDRASDATDRRNSRASIRVFSTRILQLQSLDFDAARKFFDREYQFSRALGRSDGEVMDDTIDSRIEAHLEEHYG